VRRTAALIAVALALIALALTLGACGGDDGETSTNPAPSGATNGSGPPPSTGALPQELVECYAEKGYRIESPAQIHSAPPQVIQECFGALHEGGGSP
jgi:hypothetical protein